MNVVEVVICCVIVGQIEQPIDEKPYKWLAHERNLIDFKFDGDFMKLN